jgi:hypothetical protein
VLDFTLHGRLDGRGRRREGRARRGLARTRREPLVIFTSSGGARMHEGMFSLLQMAKTSAALASLNDAAGSRSA